MVVSPSAFEAIRIMVEFTPNGKIDDKVILMMLVPAAIIAVLLTIIMPRYSRLFWMLTLAINILALIPLLDYYEGCTAITEISGPQIGFVISLGALVVSLILLILGLIRQPQLILNSANSVNGLIKSRQN